MIKEMNNPTLKERLDELREEYKTASPKEREAICEEAWRLQGSVCRQCGKGIKPDTGFYFCSTECQNAYWGPAIEKKTSNTIKEVQLKCLEYAAKLREEKRKLNPWEREATIEDARLIFNQK